MAFLSFCSEKIETRTKMQHQKTPNLPQKHPESLWGTYIYFMLYIFELEWDVGWTHCHVNPALLSFLSLMTLMFVVVLIAIMKALLKLMILFSLISSLSISFDKSPSSPSATSRLVSPLSPRSPPPQSPGAEPPHSPAHSGSVSPASSGDTAVRQTQTPTDSTAVLFSIVSLQNILWWYHGAMIVIPWYQWDLYGTSKNSIVLPWYIWSRMISGLPLEERWRYDIYCNGCNAPVANRSSRFSQIW